MSTPENGSIFPLRDLPRYEELRLRAARYPQIEPSAVEAALMLFRVSTDGLLAFDTYLAQIKMTAGRMSVLTILNRDPKTPLSPSVLADRAGVTRATMTGLLDRLERDRLIKRSLDRHDRRKATVSLTTKGQTFLDGAMPGYYERIASMMSGLSQQEQQLLTGLLYRISDRIATVTESRTGGSNGKAAPVSSGRKAI
ncbi:MAG TPA: MarR family transcriptional regulator [Tepidisphaeraceae bacterium]|jgi:DNA-binding MarR family transcriptional regulator|nr:MarR family transcriptional regulator [Tepidisphaeraceae bacterium]